METVQHSRLLESHNTQLQNSLFDIAQIVLDDADRDDQESNVAHAANGNASSIGTTSSSVLTRSASKPIIRPAG